MLDLARRYGCISGPDKEDCQGFCLLKLVQAGDVDRGYAITVICNARRDYLRHLQTKKRLEFLRQRGDTRPSPKDDTGNRQPPFIIGVNDDVCLVLYLWGLKFYQIARVLRISKNRAAARVKTAAHGRWLEGIRNGFNKGSRTDSRGVNGLSSHSRVRSRDLTSDKETAGMVRQVEDTV